MIIIKFLVFFLLLAFLEINKNTLLGWFLSILIFGGYLYLSESVLKPHKWFTGVLLFLAFLLLFSGIVFLSWPPVKAVKAVDLKDPIRTEVVHTDKGDVRGVLNEEGSVEIFAGIPYAKPPVGELRWKEPQDNETWDGILEADTYAPMSMQPVNLPFFSSIAHIVGYHDYKISLNDNYREPVSEDSLYLNIWRPHDTDKDLPVIVYIHGGSLQTGQPWYEDYAGEGLAEKGCIVVNMGYRLGVFGFLATEDLKQASDNHTTGNYGLLDTIKALEWVQKNITSFGGDPQNVTICGESAGAVLVSALAVSPLSEGLFDKIIMESSTVASPLPPHSYRSFEAALSSGKELLKRYNVSSAEELRALPAGKLVQEADTQHHITIDGYTLEKSPDEYYKEGSFHEKAALHGYNLKESGPFILFSQANMKNYEEKVRAYFKDYADEVLALYPASNDEEAKENWADIYSCIFFDYSHYCYNRHAGNNHIPVYEYVFSKDNGRLGSWHSGELVYAFGMIPDDSKLYDEKDRSLSDMMCTYWANFAKTGDPNGKDLPEWKQNSDSASLIEFSDDVSMIQERHLALFAVLDRLYAR